MATFKECDKCGYIDKNKDSKVIRVCLDYTTLDQKHFDTVDLCPSCISLLKDFLRKKP